MREFAAEAADRGALVLYGACDAVVRPPYGPFVEALEQLARVTRPRRAAGRARHRRAASWRGWCPTSARAGDLPPPVAPDPDTERHRLHTAVADLLTASAAGGRCCSCSRTRTGRTRRRSLLLRHLARASGGARLLLLATFRDTDAEVPDALSETLADLRRSDDVVRLRLAGLSGDEVTEFVRARRRGSTGPARARRDDQRPDRRQRVPGLRAVARAGGHRRRRGRRRRRSGSRRPLAELGTPESVREVVGERLARLRPATSDLLELAATAGAEFELETSARAAGADERTLLGALDEAVAQRDDRGAARRAGSPTASRTSWSGARSTTG